MPSVELPPGFPPMVTNVEIPPVVWILGKEPLHDVVELVAMYSALVYRNMATEECRFMRQTLQLQEKDALDQGTGVEITEWKSVYNSINVYFQLWQLKSVHWSTWWPYGWETKDLNGKQMN